MTNVAMLVLDSDIASLNAIIEGFRVEARNHATQITGLLYGGRGLFEEVKDLSQIVKDLTTRKAPINDYQAVIQTDHYNLKEGDTGKSLVERLERLRIDKLAVLAGNNGIKDFQNFLYGTNNMGDYRDNVVIIPKSMNNDVGRMSEESGPVIIPGYATAAYITAKMTQDILKGATNQSRMMLIEVFGKYTGWTTAAAKMGGSHFLVMPDTFRRHDYETVMSELTDGMRVQHSDYKVAVATIGEGVPISEEERGLYLQKIGSDSDIKYPLKNKVDDYEIKLRDRLQQGNYPRINLGTEYLRRVLRWSPPTILDINIALNYGKKAAQVLFNGETGTMPFLPVDILMSKDPELHGKDIKPEDLAIVKLDKLCMQVVPDHYLHGVLQASGQFEGLLKRITADYHEPHIIS